jgi:hypothetical protein
MFPFKVDACMDYWDSINTRNTRASICDLRLAAHYLDFDSAMEHRRLDYESMET